MLNLSDGTFYIVGPVREGASRLFFLFLSSHSIIIKEENVHPSPPVKINQAHLLFQFSRLDLIPAHHLMIVFAGLRLVQ